MPKKTLLFLLLFLHTVSLFSVSDSKYTHLELPIPSTTTYQSIHILELNPLKYEIKPVKALDNGIGRESVLSISSRYGAIAAINGGFFSIGGNFDGKACGALKIQDWYALPSKPRGCIGWSVENSNPIIDRLQAFPIAIYNSKKILLNGMNRPRNNGELILFTPSFHKTTLTDRNGEEVVVVGNTIQSIVKAGSLKIPENGFILSIQQDHPLLGAFQVGKSLRASIQVTPLIETCSFDEWQSVDYIVGGAPILLLKGIKITDFEVEQTISTFLSNKHARTAIGVLPSGNWLFVVVDKTEPFDGMTIYELSELMEQLGCISALNLDGGGSSTLVYKGCIKNSPRGDEDEDNGQRTTRRVSDAIVVVEKNKM